MKALTKSQVYALQSEVQAEYEATQQKIAELEAKQAELHQVLSRYNFHKALMGERTVPNYAPWLPFSS
jgi:hypothetical protein